MRQVLAYIEADVGMASDHTTAAWTFDLPLWGRCGQGLDERSALSALAVEIGNQVDPAVDDRITGDEQAFQRDQQPATDAERAATEGSLPDGAHRWGLAIAPLLLPRRSA
jgi:hypothetical protein